MPELPDVEVFKRYMDATSLYKKIRSVGLRNEKILGDVSARTLPSTLKARKTSIRDGTCAMVQV